MDPLQPNWFHEGCMDYNDGMPRLMPNRLFRYEDWPTKAREWYAGWDWTNLNDDIEGMT